MFFTPGRFVWYDLITTDPKSAQAFYGKVVGWGAQEAPMPFPYTLFTLDGVPIGGMTVQPDPVRQSGAPPSWMGHVAVADVDATVAKATSLGGKVLVAPTDIPNTGRSAVIADPQGAVIGIFRTAQPDTTPEPPPMMPGRPAWHELLTTDHEKAFAFYSALFGWTKDTPVDMGPMGIYQLFAAGGPAIGGMFNKPPMIPACFWLYYIAVSDIDAAAERVKAEGGQITNGPMEVPGGAWIYQAMDPQGAHFALVGMRA
jgi:predicted enzyme related to lactoylglutathione lyase